MTNRSPFHRMFERAVINGTAFREKILARKTHPGPYWPQAVSWKLIVSFALFVFLIFWLGDPWIIEPMRALPDDIKLFFVWVTAAGKSDWYIALSALFLLSMLFADWTRLPTTSAVNLRIYCFWTFSLFFTTAVGGFFIMLVKRTIGRARPKHFDEYGSFAFDPLSFKTSFWSFPSGHGTTIGSVLFLLLVFFPRWKWFWVSLALFIVSSRVVIGAHYPSDIFVGLACGLLMSWFMLSYLARRRLGFMMDDHSFTSISPIKPLRAIPLSKLTQNVTEGLKLKKRHNRTPSPLADKANTETR